MLDLYMSDGLFIWFNDLKATRNYGIFGRKNEQNRFLCEFYFVKCFGKLSIYTNRVLVLEEKSITSCPH